MWSVHTRNETTSRRYPPEVHADPAARGARREPISEEVVVPTGGEGRSRARRGPCGGPASARVIRQPRRCRRCQRAPTSTMRLVLSHTQGVSRPHILLLDAAGPQNERNGEEKRENVRARERFHEADLRASERPRVLLGRWGLSKAPDLSEEFVNRAAANGSSG